MKKRTRLLGLLAVSILFFVMMLTAPAQAREVTLTWEPNSEPDLSHYVVYRGTESGVYAENSGNIGLVTTYTCTIPDDGNVYFFAVTAVDKAGLESDFSNEVNTEKSDSLIDSATNPPADPTGNKLVNLKYTGPDGSTYMVEGSKLTIIRPDGSIIVIQ